MKNTKIQSQCSTINSVCVCVCEGDGIGPEIMNSVLEILKVCDVPINFIPVKMGKKVNDSGITQESKELIEKYGIVLKSPLETPKGNGVKSINVTARKMWNTYANVRPFKMLPGIKTPFSNYDIDITVIRENIEDTYGSIEHMQTHDVAQCRRLITRPGCIQIHTFAFEYCIKHNIKKITCGHKANIMKLTDGLFLSTFYEIAKNYPQITANDIIVDNLAMKLVTQPQNYKCIVLPNLQGDIISDLCSGLIGGLGVSPSCNIGEHVRIYEAIHGSAPDIANQNIANPIALLLSALQMLDDLKLHSYSTVIKQTLYSLLQNGFKTKDLGGTLSTSEFTKHMISKIKKIKESKDAIFTDIIQKTNDNLCCQTSDNQEPFRTNFVMKTSNETKTKKTIGFDLFIDSPLLPNELSKKLNNILQLTNRFTLEMISNRGTQVYPIGSYLTTCVNHHRCRILFKDEYSRDYMWDTLYWIGCNYRICSLEMLITFDDQPGFSLAQGQ